MRERLFILFGIVHGLVLSLTVAFAIVFLYPQFGENVASSFGVVVSVGVIFSGLLSYGHTIYSSAQDRMLLAGIHSAVVLAIVIAWIYWAQKALAQ